jgi:dCTP deaminase
MVINGDQLVAEAPIRGMLTQKVREHGVSHGLAEVGYDIRVKQTIQFWPSYISPGRIEIIDGDDVAHQDGRFCLASSVEEFDMPANLVGIVHDKSTWARRGLSVFNTVIEPGWKGFLTLELVYHGVEPLLIPAGAGIAQVIFHQTFQPAEYEGKYQHQQDRPVPAIAD